MTAATLQENRSRRTPAAFLPYQARWAADMAQVKFCEKSRRVGLSWAEAGEDALLAASASGMDVWYIGYNKDMALEFIEDVADWTRFYNQAASQIEETVVEDEKKDILAFRVRFASGHKIVALSSRPANLRGKQGKIDIDEAAFHYDLAGLLKAAIAMLMWGGRVAIISTHNGEDNAFNEIVRDIRAGRKPYSLHRITLDDALAEGLYERICLRLGRDWTPEGQAAWRQELIDFYGDDADEELFCVPSRGSGIFLSRALIESCLSEDIPVIRYEPPAAFVTFPELVRQAETQAWCEDFLQPWLKGLNPLRNCVVGEDFGRSGDLSVILPLQEQQKATWRAVFHLELRNVPFQQQEQIFYFVCGGLPRFRYAALDARGNGQYLAERAMQRYGAGRVAQVMLSETWYRENMPRYKAAFEDRSLLLAKDADIIEDHRAFKMVKGVAKLPEAKNRGIDKKQRHGDEGVAGAMAWFATYAEAAGPIEFESTGVRRTFTATDRYLSA